MNKPIYITDKNGMILFVSDMSCKLIGKKKEELIGKNVSQLEKEGFFKPSVAKIVLDKKQNVSVIQQGGEGTGVITGHLILDKNDEPKYAVTLGYDIPDFVGYSSQIKIEELDSAFRYYLQELQKLKAKLVRTKEVPFFIGQSRVYDMLKETIEKVACVETTVLITGETGVGKTLIAERIHHLSDRKDRPFIHLNCAAIPELLLIRTVRLSKRSVYRSKCERQNRTCQTCGERHPFLRRDWRTLTFFTTQTPSIAAK